MWFPSGVNAGLSSKAGLVVICLRFLPSASMIQISAWSCFSGVARFVANAILFESGDQVGLMAKTPLVPGEIFVGSEPSNSSLQIWVGLFLTIVNCFALGAHFGSAPSRKYSGGAAFLELALYVQICGSLSFAGLIAVKSMVCVFGLGAGLSMTMSLE